MPDLTTLHQTRQRIIERAEKQQGQSGVTETRRRLQIVTHQIMKEELRNGGKVD